MVEYSPNMHKVVGSIPSTGDRGEEVENSPVCSWELDTGHRNQALNCREVDPTPPGAGHLLQGPGWHSLWHRDDF